jgi:hypothetical protein
VLSHLVYCTRRAALLSRPLDAALVAGSRWPSPLERRRCQGALALRPALITFPHQQAHALLHWSKPTVALAGSSRYRRIVEEHEGVPLAAPPLQPAALLVVHHFAHLDRPLDELGANRFDIGDDQLQAME